jgi:capsular exopolysaccharide synthesis family protein
MSHVRNLFHKPQGTVPFPTPVSVAAAPEYLAKAFEKSELAPNASSLPEYPANPATVAEFPVEAAHIRPEHRLVFYTDPHSPAADRFRYLRMRLREPWSKGKLKKILITSSLSNEGKSTVILNLATALSERGQRAVLVVDADLHKSCLGEKLGLKTWAGLSECLHDGFDPLSAIRRIDPFGWHFLPAGEPPKHPTELLQSPALPALLQRVSPHFDWILIDSPPTIPLTDALTLQQHVDACLLVVRADRTPREAVEQATSLLGTKNIVGVVLNGLASRNHLYTKYHPGSNIE